MANSAVITVQEVLDAPKADDQAILAILKDKGMPLIGVTLLKLDPDYTYESIRGFDDHTTTYSWTLKDA